MNLRKVVLAAILGALPILFSSQVLAAGPTSAAPADQAARQSAALLTRLAATRAAHRLDANHGFAITVQHPGAPGTRISRVAHTYKGVRVFQSESVVVTNQAGDIVSEALADRRGKLAIGASARGFDVAPTLQPAAATALVVKSLGLRVLTTHQVPPTAELIIYPLMASVRVPAAQAKLDAQLNALDLTEEVTGYELAYLVKTRMLEGARPVYFDTIVSARDGRVLKQWKALQTVAGTGKSQYNGSVPLSTTLTGSNYTMRDPLRGTGGTYGAMAITNANHGSSAGSIYSNTSNNWGDGLQYNGRSTTDANGQTAAVNAMWGLMNTYDTLKNVLGWQSLDGENTATYIAAHVYTNYDNAYYSDVCRCMFIGDGGSYFTNLASIDVIGHEMAHGVTNATSDLIYEGEPGGLNESHSDITGEMVEAYARAGGTGNAIPGSGNDWMMGKEISRSGQPLRWMYKPSLDGESADAWSRGLDDLDVHYSSGPNNRMFYFLAQGSNASSSSDRYSRYLVKNPRAMTGIGSDRAYRIWFRALTTKFTSATNYAEARNKVLQAAQELYGVNSREAIAVTRAYAAINVGEDIDENGGGGDGGGVSISSHPVSKTVAPGTAVAFSVSATGGREPYRYQWLRNGAVIVGATSPTYSLIAQSGDNGAVFSARVSDAADTPTTATSTGATLTVTSDDGGGQAQRIVNGGFESGAAGWSGSTSVIGSHNGEQPPYEGSNIAWLGGNGFARAEFLTQTLSIPATATSARLSFALHIDTAESENRVYDKLVVTVKGDSGELLATLATYTNLDQASGYQLRSFDLSAYKGRTIWLSFYEQEDSSQQTSFVLDQVSVVTQ